MAAKKLPAKQEPLLNAVARKLGHAAGTFAKVTKEVTGNLSAIPETVTTKMREVANDGTLAERSRTGARRPKKRIRRAPSAEKAKGATPADKRIPRKSKSSRSSRKSNA